jgi:cell division septal protein FtsQ
MNELWIRPENEAERRRARAQAHLAKRRGGTRPKIRRGPRVVVAAFAAGLGVVIGAPVGEWLLGMDGRPVDALAIHGASQLRPDAIAKQSGIAPGADLGTIEVGAVASALEAEPWIEHARALTLPSGTVVLAVQERVAAAIATIDDTHYAVDHSGRAFAQVSIADHPRLPRIQATEAPTDAADPRFAQAITLAERLPAYGIATQATVVVPKADDAEGFLLSLPGVPARIVLGAQEPEARLAPLAELMARRPDAVAMATNIDLRFANQVVLRTAPARDGSSQNAAARGRAKSTLGPPTG